MHEHIKHSPDGAFQTLCCDDSLLGEQTIRSHTPPIYATSTFVYPPLDAAIRIFEEKEERPYLYNRWGTPNSALIEAKIAALEAYGIMENGRPLQLAAVLFSSGMGAVSSLFLSLGLRRGDRIVTQGNLYGTTTEFLDTMITPHGIEVCYGDLHDLVWVEDMLSRGARNQLVYVESPTNATARCYDLTQLSALARKYGARCAVDSTLATPFLQKPFRFGVDFVVHSATKFMNGHSNALAGVVVGRDQDFVKTEVWKMRKLLGASAGSFDAWLLNMGIKTLPLRMQRHCDNAQQIAEFLTSHKHVRRVMYLGLPDHPDHAIAARQMRAFGGVLSFEVRGGRDAAVQVLKNIRKCTVTATIGVMDTLIQHPALMTHIKVPREQREQHGISDELLRVSVGLEDADTVIADLDQALNTLDATASRTSEDVCDAALSPTSQVG